MRKRPVVEVGQAVHRVRVGPQMLRSTARDRKRVGENPKPLPKAQLLGHPEGHLRGPIGGAVVDHYGLLHQRSTPGSEKGRERASSLTLKTAVNPESEESSTQFQRTAYSGSPSLFFHLARLRASITHLPQNLGIVSDREGPYPLRLRNCSALYSMASTQTFYTLKVH